ncbi:DUF6011 domain-containing protein [Nonomuraea sp. NPDC004186]
MWCVCGNKPTDPVSLAYGIGPDCRRKPACRALAGALPPLFHCQDVTDSDADARLRGRRSVNGPRNRPPGRSRTGCPVSPGTRLDP